MQIVQHGDDGPTTDRPTYVYLVSRNTKSTGVDKSQLLEEETDDTLTSEGDGAEEESVSN